MSELSDAVTAFRKQFGKEPDIAVFAPGRVNLIGEHTDYNEGFVLPFALPFKTVIVGSRSTKISRIFSSTIADASAGPISFNISESLVKGTPEWANYVKGTVFQYIKELPPDAAFDAVISSTVPLGSGLSSSAALEVATATFLENLFDINSVDGVQKALRCQKAEHDFADTPCGIMDQFISAMGKEGNLLLIDCRTQIGTLVPFGSGQSSPVFLVTNSNVKHTLSGSEYPERVAQCQAAVKALKSKYPQITSLRDATIEMLESIKTDLADERIYKRGRHVITEDVRTTGAVEALKKGDFATVGILMSQSHDSLQHDYEVSCSELDVLKRLALDVRGVYGSRMTGGGFGGCTVTLVERSAVPELKKYLTEKYNEITGKTCTIYEAEPSAGAGILQLPKSEESATSKPASDTTSSRSKDEQSRSAIIPYLEYAVPLGVLALALTVLFQAWRSRKW